MVLQWGKHLRVIAMHEVDDLVETKIDPVVGYRAPLPRSQQQHVIPSGRIYTGAFVFSFFLKGANCGVNLKADDRHFHEVGMGHSLKGLEQRPDVHEIHTRR
jgi:hypothetical protein